MNTENLMRLLQNNFFELCDFFKVSTHADEPSNGFKSQAGRKRCAGEQNYGNVKKD